MTRSRSDGVFFAEPIPRGKSGESRPMRRLSIVLAALLLSVTSTGWGEPPSSDFPLLYNTEQEPTSPLPAAAAAAGMQVPAGFRVSLFAAEPDVQNPIAMAWDDRGRLWVAENYTYAEREQRFDLTLRDRVLILADEDRDGRAESRKVFTDHVQMLTSVELGRGGVWLMCPPRLLFLPDANGDDVPDGPAQVKLDGFAVARDNYHNFANGLRWGPDGWLYGRCGHSCPGRLGVPGTSDGERVPIDGGMWRFHPDRQVVEVLCHGTVNPWGHDWDRHGELFFINTVIGHVWHVLPGAHFKESFGESENPAVYERLDTIADHYHFDTKGNWADSRDGQANELGGGHAHIGAMIYQGQQWPEVYRGKLFTLNMHGRRANVDRLERAGAGFVARHEPDFLIAADPWFRGLEMSAGPDGSVYVIDWSDTGECHEHNGVHRTSGRVFKISYGEPQTPRPVSKPACLDGPGKLPELWKRYQRNETTPTMLRELLDDPDEHVRVWAVRLLTDFWPLDTIVGPRANAVYPDDPDARAALVRLAQDDASGLVQLVLASTLQRLPARHRPELARAILSHEEYADDRDLPTLVWFGLIPVGSRDLMALVSLAQECRWPKTLRSMTRYVASRVEDEPQALNALLTAASGMSEERQNAVLLGLQDAYRGWRKVSRPAAWDAFVTSSAAQRMPAVTRELSSLFGDGRALEEIRRVVLDDKAELQTRQAALRTLIDARPPDLRAFCESLLSVRVLNATAARGLALFDDPRIGARLASEYRRFQPVDRPAVLETLVSRPSFAAAMLDYVGEGRKPIPPSDISAFHARQIRSFEDEALDRKLAEVWGELRESPADRQQAMAAWRDQLLPEATAQADPRHGRALFRKVCAQCHTLFGEGEKIGPDLTGAQRSNLDYLLENILDPSAVVAKDFRMTVVRMTDGRVLNGLVVSQDDQTLTIQTPTDKLTLNLADIEEMKLTPLSPMPDGLLNNLPPEQVRHLFAFLMQPAQVPLPDDRP